MHSHIVTVIQSGSMSTLREANVQYVHSPRLRSEPMRQRACRARRMQAGPHRRSRASVAGCACSAVFFWPVMYGAYYARIAHDVSVRSISQSQSTPTKEYTRLHFRRSPSFWLTSYLSQRVEHDSTLQHYAYTTRVTRVAWYDTHDRLHAVHAQHALSKGQFQLLCRSDSVQGTCSHACQDRLSADRWRDYLWLC